MDAGKRQRHLAWKDVEVEGKGLNLKERALNMTEEQTQILHVRKRVDRVTQHVISCNTPNDVNSEVK